VRLRHRFKVGTAVTICGEPWTPQEDADARWGFLGDLPDCEVCAEGEPPADEPVKPPTLFD
jgi:hypothetical protein